MIERINRIDQMPAVFYFHPWGSRRTTAHSRCRRKTRFRHYVNIHRMEAAQSFVGRFRGEEWTTSS